jgi:hypothetical protein
MQKGLHTVLCAFVGLLLGLFAVLLTYEILQSALMVLATSGWVPPPGVIQAFRVSLPLIAICSGIFTGTSVYMFLIGKEDQPKASPIPKQASMLKSNTPTGESQLLIGRNVDEVFKTQNGVVLRLNDTQALCPVGNEYKLFSSFEAYRRYAKDSSMWIEITDPRQKEMYVAEIRALLGGFDNEPSLAEPHMAKPKADNEAAPGQRELGLAIEARAVSSIPRTVLLDVTEQRYRIIYPLLRFFTYQAQGGVEFVLLILPIVPLWQGLVRRSWWAPTYFSSDAAFVAAALLFCVFWLFLAWTLRHYMKLAVLFLLPLIVAYVFAIVEMGDLVHLPAAAIAGFVRSGHPFLALGSIVLAGLTLLFSIYLIVVMLRGVIVLMRITPQQRRIMTETSGGSTFLNGFLIRILGFPVSVEYARKPLARYGLIIFLCLFGSLAMLGFIVQMIQLPAMGIDGFVMLWAQCGAVLACYDGLAFTTLTGPTVGVAIFALISLAIGGATHRLIRQLLRISLERLQQIDQRPPIVFLRAFRDDQVPLRSPRLGALGRVMDVGRRRTSLDEMLLEEATPFGPVVALGNPQDKKPPYGAARGYFDQESWQVAVADLVSKGLCVIICVDDTDGIWWEIDHLVDGRHIGKTLLLIHPKYAALPANEALIPGLVRRLRADHATIERVEMIPLIATDGGPPTSIIGLFFDQGGAIRLIESRTFSRFAYLLAIRMFLRRDQAPPPNRDL